MSTFGAMKNRIADEISRDDMSSQIEKAIQSAITFYESERLWFNEAESTASTVADQQGYALPSDFLEADELTVTVSGDRFPLTLRSWGWFRNRDIAAATTTGEPTDWAYYADQMWLYPTPDQAYTITLSYLKRLSALSATSDTNAWMTHGEELIRSRAKADLFANVIRDFEEATAMKQLEQMALANLVARSGKRLSTGRLRPTAF